jgi:hypothetical protein
MILLLSVVHRCPFITFVISWQLYLCCVYLPASKYVLKHILLCLQNISQTLLFQKPNRITYLELFKLITTYHIFSSMPRIHSLLIVDLVIS